MLVLVVMVVVLMVMAAALVVLVVMVMVVMPVVMAALVIIIVIVILGREAVELGRQAVLTLHDGAQGLAVKLVPGGGDDGGVGVPAPQQRDAFGELFGLHAGRAGQDDGAGVLDLVIPEFAEVFHIHLRARGVHNGGEAAGDELGVAHALNGEDNVRKLADAGGLYEHAVGGDLGLDLLERLGKVAHERAADAARAHLLDLYAGLGEKAAVHRYVAELVFDEHELFAGVGLGNELFDERRFSGAQKAGKDIDFCHW